MANPKALVIQAIFAASLLGAAVACSPKEKAGIVLSVDTAADVNRQAITSLQVTVDGQAQSYPVTTTGAWTLGIITTAGSRTIVVDGMAGTTSIARSDQQVVTATSGKVVAADVTLRSIAGGGGLDGSSDGPTATGGFPGSVDGSIGGGGAGQGGAIGTGGTRSSGGADGPTGVGGGGAGAAGSGGTPGLGGVTATGGIPGAGGVAATGGTRPGGSTGSGGISATGGIANAGGSQATGGRPGSGGASSAGGTPGSGGNPTGGAPATGGATGSGGASAAGGATGSGGAPTTGGATGSGGAPATGGATGSGGVPATGGATGTGGGGGGSPGCSLANTTSPCSTSGTTCSLTVNGTPRAFYVQLPSGYASSNAYPVVFQFHPLGGTAEQTLTLYGIRGSFPGAIYVTPQGVSSVTGGSAGWDNTGGQDVAFTKAMLDYLDANYCVDQSRIFATGFSAGGIMTLTLGCQMPAVFRAIGVDTGMLQSSCNPSHMIALWQSQGDQDTAVPPASAESARDVFVKKNGCASTTQAVDPSPCVAYDGCASGYPVVWCLIAGGVHQIPSFAGQAIATFFQQF